MARLILPCLTHRRRTQLLAENANEFPEPEELARFLKSIVDAGDIAPQSCVLFVVRARSWRRFSVFLFDQTVVCVRASQIFLDRLRERMTLTAVNWKRVVLAALILGCKVRTVGESRYGRN